MWFDVHDKGIKKLFIILSVYIYKSIGKNLGVRHMLCVRILTLTNYRLTITANECEC